MVLRSRRIRKIPAKASQRCVLPCVCGIPAPATLRYTADNGDCSSQAPPSSDEALGLSPVIPPAAADPVPKEQAAEVSLPTTTDGSFSKAKEMSAEEAGQWKAVHSAARWGKYEEVNKMVRTSNVDLQDPINGNFTIHIAAQVCYRSNFDH